MWCPRLHYLLLSKYQSLDQRAMAVTFGLTVAPGPERRFRLLRQASSGTPAARRRNKSLASAVSISLPRTWRARSRHGVGPAARSVSRLRQVLGGRLSARRLTEGGMDLFAELGQFLAFRLPRYFALPSFRSVSACLGAIELGFCYFRSSSHATIIIMRPKTPKITAAATPVRSASDVFI